MLRLSITRQSSQIQNAVGILAVLLLLIGNVSHMHVRYCLDGQDAAVSIHFENGSSHADEISDETESLDVETELKLDTLLAKVFDGTSVAIANSFTTHLFTNPKQPIPLPAGPILVPKNPASLLPPLRAPPATA